MQPLVLVLHVLIAMAIISLVLVQHGKGADMGASFGGGAANTMFGSVGPASFLMKLTSILGLLFFATSLVLVVLAGRAQRNDLDFLRTPPATPAVNLAPSMAPEVPASLGGDNTLPSLPPAGA